LAVEQAERDKAAWEAEKAAMSKRDRKKAEKKEAEDAAAAAVAAEAAKAEAEAKRAEAEAAEARRLSDPAVQHDMAYAKAFEGTVRVAVASALDEFVDRVVAVAKEPKA